MFLAIRVGEPETEAFHSDGLSLCRILETDCV